MRIRSTKMPESSIPMPVIVDAGWAMVGPDNLNRRSWTHDSELSIAVLDSTPADTAEGFVPGPHEHPREFSRSLRLRLWREHLDRDTDDTHDLLDPKEAFDAFRAEASALHKRYATGSQVLRPRTGASPTARTGPDAGSLATVGASGVPLLLRPRQTSDARSPQTSRLIADGGGRSTASTQNNHTPPTRAPAMTSVG